MAEQGKQPNLPPERGGLLPLEQHARLAEQREKEKKRKGRGGAPSGWS